MTVSDRLRALADWFEAHPDAEVPYDLRKSRWYHAIEDKDALKCIGSFDKRWTDSSLHCQVSVCDEATLVYFIDRSSVCTARVVGKREVPATRIEGTPTKIIPAHEEDVIEWECNAVLDSVSGA